MSHKTVKQPCYRYAKWSLTLGILTVFCCTSARATSNELTATNQNLQRIYERMKQKYAEHDRQQAALAAQRERERLQREADKKRQSVDVPAINVVNSTAVSEFSVADATNSRFSVGEELILDATLNGQPLSSVIGIQSATGLQIGLSDFLQLTEIPIQLDVDALTAEGWFQRESNRFSLRAEGDELVGELDGKSFRLTKDDYQHIDDLYINVRFLQAWFGISHELNEERLTVAFRSADKLPTELRAARLNNQNRLVSRPSDTSVLPLQASGYTAFSPPMLDVQAWANQAETVYTLTDAQQQSTTQTHRNSTGSYSVLASHDLAYLNSELFLAGNDEDSLTNAWFTLSRQSDRNDLLGLLGATEYAFGDVTPVNAGIGGTQQRSLGFSLGNTPMYQLADNRRVNLVGELQAGWDVELYRNGVLIDQRLGVSDGRYEFNDTLLEYGNNDFELIFYGPQGQIERKTESYIVDSNTVKGGEAQYRVSVVEVGQTVFNVDEGTNDPTREGTMVSSIVDLGVTNWLALTAGTSVLEPKVGDTQQFLMAGANLSLGRAGLINSRFQQNKDDLSSVTASYRTRLWNTSYTLGYSATESLSGVDQTVVSTDTAMAQMSGILFDSSRLPVSFQNAWYRTEFEDVGRRDEAFENSIGVGGRFGYLTNNVTFRNEVYDAPIIDSLDPLVEPQLVPRKEDSVVGKTQYRKSFGRLHTRFFSDYEIKPLKEMYTYGGVLNYTWNQNLNSEFRFTQYELMDQYQLNLGVNWRKDAFYLNTNAGYNENGSWSAGIGLRFSLGYEPLGRSVFTSNRPIAQSGAVSARVFEDLNMNGVFDADEPVVEGATVKAIQGYRQSKTNADGVAVLSALPSNIVTDIVVDESTLDGPFMIKATPGVAIKSRKGYVDRVDLPVVKAGELDGVIYLNENGESQPAPYILLNLVDNKNNVVATTRSEFDGYYLFSNVKPGAYTLRVDDKYTDRHGLKEATKPVSFSAKGDVIEGVDFVLRPLEQANGYVASVGEFKTPETLKLYYHLLRNKVGHQFLQTPFYIKKPDNQGYLLGVAYFEGNPVTGKKAELNALDACEKLAVYQIRCDVQYHDFSY